MLDHPDENLVGQTLVRDKPYASARKNEETVINEYDQIEKELFHQTVVYAGYHDFEDDEDYQNRAANVIYHKIQDIDQEFIDRVNDEQTD